MFLRERSQLKAHCGMKTAGRAWAPARRDRPGLNVRDRSGVAPIGTQVRRDIETADLPRAVAMRARVTTMMPNDPCFGFDKRHEAHRGVLCVNAVGADQDRGSFRRDAAIEIAAH